MLSDGAPKVVRSALAIQPRSSHKQLVIMIKYWNFKPRHQFRATLECPEFAPNCDILCSKRFLNDAGDGFQCFPNRDGLVNTLLNISNILGHLVWSKIGCASLGCFPNEPTSGIDCVLAMQLGYSKMF